KHPNLVNDYARGAGNVFYRDNTTRYAPHNVMMHGNNVAPFTALHGIAAPISDITPKHADGTFTGAAAAQISVPDHGSLWQYYPGSKHYLQPQARTPFVNVVTAR